MIKKLRHCARRRHIYNDSAFIVLKLTRQASDNVPRRMPTNRSVQSVQSVLSVLSVLSNTRRHACKQARGREVNLFSISGPLLLSQNFVNMLNAAEVISCDPVFTGFFKQPHTALRIARIQQHQTIEG